MIKDGFTENIAVFCNWENYAEAEAFILSDLPEGQVVPVTK